MFIVKILTIIPPIIKRSRVLLNERRYQCQKSYASSALVNNIKHYIVEAKERVQLATKQAWTNCERDADFRLVKKKKKIDLQVFSLIDNTMKKL